jgi:uncharacterized protein YeaO (DUF488 family)
VIAIKRAYEPAARGDGIRFLVDRLWPRGISKAALQITSWVKDAAPSDALRRWFKHDPEKWDEFRRRYRQELDDHSDSWRPIVTASRRGRVTLVYSAHDAEHNNAMALKAYLETKRRQPRHAVAAARPRRSQR